MSQMPAPRTLTLFADGGFCVDAYYAGANFSETLYAHFNPNPKNDPWRAIECARHQAAVIEWEQRQGAAIVDQRKA